MGPWIVLAIMYVIFIILDTDHHLAVQTLNFSDEQNSSSLNISWILPQDFEAVNIKYCVDVVNKTSALLSECNITETRYTYNLPARSWCEVYRITVTPVNCLGNGTNFTEQFSRSQPGRVCSRMHRCINTCLVHH